MEEGVESMNNEYDCWKELDLQNSLESVFQKHGLNRRNIRTIIHEIFKDENVKKILKDGGNSGSLNLPNLTRTRSNFNNVKDICGPGPEAVGESSVQQSSVEMPLSDVEQSTNSASQSRMENIKFDNAFKADIGNDYNFEFQYFKDKYCEIDFDMDELFKDVEEADDEILDPDFDYFHAKTQFNKEDEISDDAVRVSKNELDDLLNEISENTVKSSTPQKLHKSESPVIPKKINQGSLKHCAELLKTYFKVKSSKERTAYLTRFPFLRKLLREMKQYSVPRHSVSLCFSKPQRHLLQEQMQMHVQLLTQTNLLCKNNSNFSSYEEESYQLVSEIDYFKNLSKVPLSAFYAENLETSKILCTRPLPISKPMKGMPKYLNKKGYLPITRALAKTFAYSKTFMYLNLLPLSAAQDTSHVLATFPFILAEDSLLAMGLHELKDMLMDCATLIKEIYLPAKSVKSIRNRIKNVMIQNEKESNPIKRYKLFGILPEQHKHTSQKEKSDWKKPINCPNNGNLPYWLESLQYQRDVKQQKKKYIEMEDSYMPNSYIPIVTQEQMCNPEAFQRSSTSASLEATLALNENVLTNEHQQSVSIANSIKSSMNFINEIKSNKLLHTNKPSPSINAVIRTPVRPILPKQTNSPSTANMLNRPKIDDLTNKTENKTREQVEALAGSKFTSNTPERKGSPIVAQEELEIKSMKRKDPIKPSLRIKLFKTNSGHRMENVSFERKNSPIPNELNEENVNKMNLFESNLSNLLAEQYIKQVQEYFSDTPENFVTFIDLMTKFSMNNECPTALFFNVKELFQDDDELLRGFVPFLLPNQALECGVYKDFFIYSNAKKFLYKLKTLLRNEEEKFQNILEIFNNSTSELELKNKILPLLNDNDELQNSFLMFFDNEKVPETFLSGNFEEVLLQSDPSKNDPLFEEVKPTIRRHHIKHKRISTCPDVPDQIIKDCSDQVLIEENKENIQDISCVSLVSDSDVDDQVEEVLSNVEEDNTTDQMSDSEHESLEDDIERVSPLTFDKDYLMDDNESMDSDCSDVGSVNTDALSNESDVSNHSYVEENTNDLDDDYFIENTEMMNPDPQ